VDYFTTPTPVAAGYLRGYSRQDIDIRIRAGVLEEGVDYTIAPENLVGFRGAITVTGSDRHFDEVVISIADSSDIRLVDPTKKGLIKINLEQNALFGSDKDLVQANRHTLTLEVVDGRVIRKLEGTEMTWKTTGIEKPTQGDVIPDALTIGGTAYSEVILNWDTKTYNNRFYKVKDTPVKATVKLQAAPDLYFLGSIGPSDIQNDTSFADGVPEVSDISVSEDGKTLEFVLSYDVFAVKIIKATPTLIDAIDIDTLTSGGFVYGIKDLFSAAGLPLHKDTLPAAEVLLNSYFEIEGSIDKVWSGSVDTEKGYFVGVKGTPKAQATATITLKPKVGYTFDGTDLLIGDFVAAAGVPFINGAKAGSSLTSGPEGSLILTIVYDITEKPIAATAEDFDPKFLTRIARPLVGKSVRVGTPKAAATAFVATEDSPYTATVSWTSPSDPFDTGRFGANGVTATIKLTPKPGYVFIDAANTYNATGMDRILSDAVAVDAPVVGGGNCADAAPYDLNFTISYGTGNIYKQIQNLDGLNFADINPVPAGNLAVATTAIGANPPIAAGSANITPLSGLAAGSPPTFIFNTPATVQVALLPATGYSFAADDGPLPYLTYGETLDEAGTAIKKLIEDHFSQVYKGTNVPLTARVVSLEPPYLSGGALILKLKFPAKPVAIATTDIDGIGSFSAAPSTTFIPGALTAGDSVFQAAINVDSIVWTKGSDTITAGTGTFASGAYKATITLSPKSGYTFVASTGLEAALDNSTTGTWGVASGGHIALADTAINLTEVVVPAGTDYVANDKIVITLDITI
jgi:hypothetical protein